MKTNFLGLLILMTFLWASCSSDTSDTPEPTPPDNTNYALVLGTTAFPSSGSAGTALTKLKSNAPWVVEIEESAKSWVTVEPESGDGGDETVNVKIHLKRNLESNADLRRTELIFKQTGNDTVAEKYTITQYTDYYLMQDSIVLMKVFENFGGENWLRPWDTDNALINWEGIYINTVDGKRRVIGLVFDSTMNVSGNLPDELAELTALGTLGIKGEENLTGNIPESLKKTPMTHIQITYCPNFGGVFPAYLQGWETMEHFVVTGCGYYAFEEDWTGDFPNLLSFIIQDNKFKGKLERRFIKDMPKLVLAEFKNNDFEGAVPPSLFAGKSMMAFSLRMNRFTGVFPEAIRVMPAFDNSIDAVKAKDDVCPQQDGYGFDKGTCNDSYTSATSL